MKRNLFHAYKLWGCDMGDYRVILIGACNPGLTSASYRTEREAREAAAVLCVQADRVLIRHGRKVLWDSNMGAM